MQAYTPYTSSLALALLWSILLVSLLAGPVQAQRAASSTSSADQSDSQTYREGTESRFLGTNQEVPRIEMMKEELRERVASYSRQIFDTLRQATHDEELSAEALRDLIEHLEWVDRMSRQAKTTLVTTGGVELVGVDPELLDAKLFKPKMDPGHMTFPAIGPARQQQLQAAQRRQQATNGAKPIGPVINDLRDWGYALYQENVSGKCFDITTAWEYAEPFGYYNYSWEDPLQIIDIKRFKNVRANANGTITLKGTINNAGSFSYGASIGGPGLSGSISYTPPSTSGLNVQGTLQATITGLIDDSPIVITLYRQRVHERIGKFMLESRIKQRFCGGQPQSEARYETRVSERWIRVTWEHIVLDVDREIQVAGGLGYEPLVEKQRVHSHRDAYDEKRMVPVDSQADPWSFFTSTN